MASPTDVVVLTRFTSGLVTQRHPFHPGFSNEPDALIDGANMSLNNRLLYQRRPGFSRFSTVQLGASEVPLGMQTFRPLSGQRFHILDSTTRVARVESSAITTIFTKVSSAQADFAVVGDWLYIAHPDKFQKWNGSALHPVGVDAPTLAPNTRLYDDTAVNIVTTGTPGARRQANVVTITTTEDHGFAVGRSVTISGVSDASFNGNFTISAVPTANSFQYNQTGADATSGNGTATSEGTSIVSVDFITRASPGSEFARVFTLSAHGFSAGNIVTIADNSNAEYNGDFTIANVDGANSFTIQAGSALSEDGFGGTASSNTSRSVNINPPAGNGAVRTNNVVTIETQTDHGFVPGLTVVVSGVSDSSFNGVFTVTSVPSARTFKYNQTGPNASSGGGQVKPNVTNKRTTTAGWVYAYTYKRSATNAVSSASPRAVSTGAFTNKNVLVSGPRSSEAGVDFVQIWRTKDGGGILFLVAEIPNPASGDWAFLDSTKDDNINTLLIAPEGGLNDPPPDGLENVVFHSGHLWGNVGNVLYYNSGPETLVGTPEDAWKPTNFFVFPGKIQKLVSSALGLLVWLDTECWVIRGTSKSNFSTSLFLSQVGVLSKNAITTDGDNLFLFTNQKKLVKIDASSVSELSFPIAPQLDAFSPSDVYLSVLHKGSEEFSLYVGDGSSKIFRLNMVPNAWCPVWTVVGGARAIGQFQESTGPVLVIGRPSGGGFLLQQDHAVFTDDGSAFDAFLTFGSIVLAPPRRLTSIESVLVTTTAAGSEPAVRVLLQEVGNVGTGSPDSRFVLLAQSVNDPPSLPDPVTYRSRRYYLKQASLTPVAQHLQISLEWPAEGEKNELVAVAVGASPER
jgi:hypothetical protein